MKFNLTVGAVVATAALTAAVPALADKPPHPSHPSHPAHPAQPSTSHKCTAHHVAFVASGTLVSWAATKNSDGTYSGTVVVNVTRTNHHAAGSKGAQTFTLTNAKAHFSKNATPPAAGDRVRLIGKITAVAKKCTDQTGAGTITIRRADVKAAK
jgi:hypothetical protein